MAFQDEAAELFEALAVQVGKASNQEAAGVDRLLAAFDVDDPEVRAKMHAAGEKLAAIGRDLLGELGHGDLVGDANAMMFVAMAALSSVQTPGPATTAQA